MSKYTPGPWEFYVTSDGQVGVFAGESHLAEAVYASDDDMRLMAAAPELLAACKRLMAAFESPSDVTGMYRTVSASAALAAYEQAQAAIAKTKGGSKWL